MDRVDLAGELKKQVKQAIDSPYMSKLPNEGGANRGLPVQRGGGLQGAGGGFASIPIDWNQVLKFFKDPRATPGFVAWATDLLLKAINSHIAMERYKHMAQAQQVAKEAAYLNALLGKYSDLSKAYSEGIRALVEIPDPALRAAAAERLHRIGRALDIMEGQISSLYGGALQGALPVVYEQPMMALPQQSMPQRSMERSWLGALLGLPEYDTFNLP